MLDSMLGHAIAPDMKAHIGSVKGSFGQKPHSYSKETIIDNSIIDKVTGCWNWISSINQWGYGKLSIQKKHWIAHRASYFIFTGNRIPKNKIVMHVCDNRACVNPSHLRVGTHSENMADMVSKGRSASGEKNTSRKNPHLQVRGSKSPKAKLTELDVLEIKAMLAAGWQQTQISQKFEVSSNNINNIAVGLTWKHVQISTNDKKRIDYYRKTKPLLTKGSKVLNERIVADIKMRLMRGERQKDIALLYGVTKHAVTNIARGATWCNVQPWHGGLGNG